ncbi:MAG: NAD-dependent protein deacylase [Marinilabiliales bacterium]|nr:MAG: NAD-dependent protein deacylase [Marinilabiliales bacterium]
MGKKHICILSGAGMSADSGLRTFRDSNGLWKQYRFEEIASPRAWEATPDLVHEFYNMRRTQLGKVEPNAGHKALACLEDKYEVSIVTQNVDDLHERAGSSNILHLHGELRKARSDKNPDYVVDVEYGKLSVDDKCPDGHMLRPHIVWFGESVDAFDDAIEIVSSCDILIIIGTSLQVYPAASLMNYTSPEAEIYYIDPKAEQNLNLPNVKCIVGKASDKVPELVRELVRKDC